MMRSNNALCFPRISRVTLQRFSLYSSAASITVDMPIDGVFCLAGANGLGKSTFLAALSYGLTGIVADPARTFKSVSEWEVAAFAGAEAALARALDARVGPDALLGAPRTFAELRGLLQMGGQRAPELLARLAELVAVGLVLRGYALPCPRCATREWYPLAEVRESLACPGCGGVFPLPVQSPVGAELPWHYRPNGLVNRAVDLDVLPHLLALRHWSTTTLRPSCIVTGLELRRSGEADADMELDLLFVADGALHAAECKAGAKLTAKDFATARRAAALGVRAFAFATTAPSWEADTAAGIATLAAELAPDMTVRSWVAAQLLPSRT